MYDKTILFYPKFNCEVGCEYCFQEGRDRFGDNRGYDLDKMLNTVKEIGQKTIRETIIIHGGEFLGLPMDDFKYILSNLSKYYKHVVAQTSTYGLTDEHISLMKQYGMNLGVSIDGPPELNTLRGPRNPEKNKEYQRVVVENIERLRAEKIPLGFISVLTKLNATGENLDILLGWVRKNEISGRFNPMFVPNYTNFSCRVGGKKLKDLELTATELKNAWIKLADLAKMEPHLTLMPVREFTQNLLGGSNKDRATLSPCIVSRCDYISSTCNMIMPDGELSRCDRCLQEGEYYSNVGSTNIRSKVLEQTECKGCRYFSICGGGCPGEAIDSDFRHKTIFCEAYYGLYEKLENDMRVFPNITLPIDVKNYYEEYILKKRKFNPFGMNKNSIKNSPNFQQKKCNCK